MSSKQSSIRLFTQDDFKAADRIERIYIWMMHENRFILAPRDQDYADKLRQAYVIMTEHLTEKERIKMMRQIYPEYRASQILKLLDDAEALFGRFRKMNQEFQDKMSRERLLGILEELHATPEENRGKDYYKLLLDTEKLIMDLNNKIKEEEQREEDLSIPPVMFGSDPRLLHAEDVQYEEE
jgi:hypothetical protein